MTHSIRSSSRPSETRSRARLGAAAAFLAAAILGASGAGFAGTRGAYVRTIVVSPVPGDPAASGQRLLSAVGSIAPSPDDPWLVKIEPGVFDLGAESLNLVPGLEVEGSGEHVTVVQGLAQPLDGGYDLGKGVVNGADRAALRQLTVRCLPDANAGLGVCICVANVYASPALRSLTLESEGYGNHWGIRNTFGSPSIEELTIRLDGGTDNYGIVNARDSFPTVLRSTITAGYGSNLNVGVFDREGGGPALIEDSQIFALGGQEAIGIFEYTASPTDVTVDDAFVQAAEAAANTGILAGVQRFEIQGSVISGDVAVDTLGEVSVTSSELMAGATIVQADAVRLGTTRLTAGGAVLGFSEAICAGVYVLAEPVEFFATECPGNASANRPRGARQGLQAARGVAGGELE